MVNNQLLNNCSVKKLGYVILFTATRPFLFRFQLSYLFISFQYNLILILEEIVTIILSKILVVIYLLASSLKEVYKRLYKVQ